jgi:S-ribosylhomocysteine lyase LuxS involved in autoinducer biosynthesis
MDNDHEYIEEKDLKQRYRLAIIVPNTTYLRCQPLHSLPQLFRATTRNTRNLTIQRTHEL